MIDKIKMLISKFKKNDDILRLNLGERLYRLEREQNISYKLSSGHSNMSPVCFKFKRRTGRFYLIPKDEPNPHIVICGMSGFGKSTLFRSIIKDAARQSVSCIIFDAHDEHASVVESMGGKVHSGIFEGINLMALDNATVAERIANLTNLMRRVYSLGYIQATRLGECMWYTYRRFGARSMQDRVLDRDPKIGDLIYEIAIFIRNAKTLSERTTLMHLRDRLIRLNSAQFTRENINAKDLMHGIHSFSLSNMKAQEERTIYIEELLGRLYYVMKDNGRQGGVKHYIMIDEAQFIINTAEGSGDVITAFIEEGRKYGVGVVMATHSSVRLNRQIIANASTFISFYAREPSEANFVAKVIAHSYEMEYAIKTALSNLKVHQALVVKSSDRMPSIISTKSLLMLDAVGFRPQSATAITKAALRPVKVEDLAQRSNTKKGEILLAIKRGVLASYVIGKEVWVSSKNSNPGIEHEVMVNKIFEELKRCKIRSYIYDKANGPDIVAYCAKGKIAIEYESGKKNMNSTQEMVQSRSEFYKVVVVVNDIYYEKAKLALSQTGCIMVKSSNIPKIQEIFYNLN